MGDVDRSAPESHATDVVTGPQLTESAIDVLGLTLLATGGPSPALDVIFVHGLQGHPEHTWTYTPKSRSEHRERKPKTSKLKFWKRPEEATFTASGAATPAQNNGPVYWPTRLLAHDLPNARVFTYGYDSRVSHFFNGPCSQNTITDNGRALLSSIASQRQDCQGRPLMLIVHSLGGIVVKSALRISALADEVDADLRDVYQSTFAILFFGTPHRGSDWTDAGQIARRFASALGFSTTQKNLQALQGNTEILEILRDEFARMLGSEAFHITSFQESYGLKGVKGLDAKIVEPDSSGLDHIFERKIPINGNHLEICKISAQGSMRKEYDEKVRSEVFRHWRRESKRKEEQQTNQWHDTETINFHSNELLQSLKLEETTSRFDQVQEACSQTFEWVFEEPELGFISWLESGRGLYWCRGHPASGKSTLMKWVFNDPRTAAALTKRDGRQARVNFFFHDRGSEIQKSFKGLLQGVMYQILQESQEVLQSILPIRQEILQRRQPSWTEEDIRKAFRSILAQQVLQLDITLFLDALDEYSGNYEDIASFLHDIATAGDASLTKFKICFSSRPLQIFLDKFRDVPSFDIHEHTMEDIKLVIHSKMSQNARMSQYLQAGNPEDRLLTMEFGNKICLKAEGIFLWVILVLDDLLEEFTEGETVRGLMKRLDYLPPRLEDFYQHTLNRLPSKYLNDNKLIFEVLRCAIKPLQLHDLFEICRCANIPSLVECTPCTATDNVYDNDSLQRWVRSRTAGLTQLVPYKDECNDLSKYEFVDDVFCPVPIHRGQTIHEVQFLHQTVKTFSLSAYWATDLTSRYPSHGNGHVYIAKYILALLFHHPQSDSNVRRRFDSTENLEIALKEPRFWGNLGAYHLIEALAQYVPLAESTNPKMLLPSLAEFGDDRISDLFDIAMCQEKRYPPLTSVSAFAVVFELCETLDALLEQNKGKALLSSPPLLHLAVTQPPLGFYNDTKNRTRIKRILLNHGANASEVFEEYTAYERLCEFAMAYPLFGRETLAKVLPFLDAGQDPNVKIRYRRAIGQRRYHDREQCLLHYAASLADIDFITALLEHGADVNTVDEAGLTPLDWACDIDRDVYTVDEAGLTPLDWDDIDRDLPIPLQLSEMVDGFLQQPAFSGQHGLLRNHLEAASLLVSRGARFGVRTADADDKFSLPRKPLTRIHIDGLRSRGIDVDDRLIRCPQNQIRTGISGFIIEPFNALRRHIAS